LKKIILLVIFLVSSFVFATDVASSLKMSVDFNGEQSDSKAIKTAIIDSYKRESVYIREARESLIQNITVSCRSSKENKLLEGISCYACDFQTDIKTNDGDFVLKSIDKLTPCTLTKEQAISHIALKIPTIVKVNSKKLKKELKSRVEISLDNIEKDLFFSKLGKYKSPGIGSISILNRADSKVDNVTLKVFISNQKVNQIMLGSLEAGKAITKIVTINSIPKNRPNSNQNIKIMAEYSLNGERKTSSIVKKITIYAEKFIDWREPESLASFISPEIESLKKSATKAITKDKINNLFTDNIKNASLIHSSLWHDPLKYIQDPVNTSFISSIDSVQSPIETLDRMAGDCDDLTVLMASLFESVGVETAFIVLPGHVMPAINSGALAGGEVLFNLPSSLFVEIDGALFIPLESTRFDLTFAESWLKAANQIKESKNKFIGIRTRKAWKKFASQTADPKKDRHLKNRVYNKNIEKAIDKVRAASTGNLNTWSKSLSQSILNSKKITVNLNDRFFSALIDYHNGKKEESIKKLSDLCAKGSFYACFNRSVLDDTKDLPSDVNIPDSVLEMLMDSSYGVGKEITKELLLKRKLVIKLDKTKKMAAKREKEKRLKHMTVLSGNKGDSSTSSPLFMLFWKKQ